MIFLIPEKRLTNTKKIADEFVEAVLSAHAGGVVVTDTGELKVTKTTYGKKAGRFDQ